MSSLAVKEEDNRALQHELALTKDKLTKSEENQRLLLRSISKLQEIVRKLYYQVALSHHLVYLTDFLLCRRAAPWIIVFSALMHHTNHYDYLCRPMPAASAI